MQVSAFANSSSAKAYEVQASRGSGGPAELQPA